MEEYRIFDRTESTDDIHWVEITSFPLNSKVSNSTSCIYRYVYILEILEWRNREKLL